MQKEVVATLLEAFPELDADDIQWRSMGAGGEDIILSPKAQQVIPFSFECKNQERLNIWDALKQAEANATETRPGAVVFRKNRSDTYIAFEFQDFVDLLKRAPTPDSRLEGFVSLVRERLEAANQ